MTRGRFISLEGGEGCGKSTQARVLVDWLQQCGVDALATREPGGTAGAEAIRSLLLDPVIARWSVPAEAMLFAAARSDHVAALIAPALEAGRWVVCDRFIDSSLAYQGCAGGLGVSTVRELHRLGSGGLLPDITLLLRLPEHEAATRLHRRDGEHRDAIGGRGAAFHKLVAEAFDALAAAEPDRYRMIDATGDADEVHGRIRAALEPLIAAAE